MTSTSDCSGLRGHARVSSPSSLGLSLERLLEVAHATGEFVVDVPKFENFPKTSMQIRPKRYRHCRLIAQQIDRASTRMHGLLLVGTFGALPQCYPVYPRLYRIPSVIAIFGPKSKPVELLACLHLRIAITGTGSEQQQTCQSSWRNW